MPATQIWIRENGSTHSLPIRLPNQWQGEKNCLVGPFSNKEVAGYFANSVTLRQLEIMIGRIFPHRDSWYVEIKDFVGFNRR